MEMNQPSKSCDLCGRKSGTEFVDTKDFQGFFCPVCFSMMEQTSRPDGSSRLHPSHLRLLQQQIKFNQRCKTSENTLIQAGGDSSWTF